MSGSSDESSDPRVPGAELAGAPLAGDGASGIHSVASRLFAILGAFTTPAQSLSLAAITRRTGIPHGSTHRLVAELLRCGALERNDNGHFTVGIRLWEIGTLAPRALALRAVALPYMEDLYGACHQHVQLAVLDGLDAVIVERISSASAVEIASQVGGRLPLHCSGVGKVLLAHAGQETFDRAVDNGLARYTPQTIVSADRLRVVLSECRRTGVIAVRGERSPDVDSVAAKVVGRGGKVIAALSVVVEARSMPLEGLSLAVLASARGVSRSLQAG